MFQKFKQGFQDLVDEQAKTIQQQSPSGRERSSSQRSGRPGASPARRPLQRAGVGNGQEKADLSGPDPDPATFETETVGTRNEQSSTPSTGIASAIDDGIPKVNVQHEGGQGASSSNEPGVAARTDEAEAELPQEVAVKLRKLSKLEAKYSDLLRAYRKAHARNASIEPFEAQLREHTPLTSINEPAALVDYLKQLSQRGDMVMDELKKVSAQKDDMKSKLEIAENRARTAVQELQDFKSKAGADEASSAQGDTPAPSSEPSSPVTQDASQRSPGLASLPSPKKKPQHFQEESEEVFSFDEEVPRLQAEVESRDAQIKALESGKASLKRELVSARESAEQMMHELESKQQAMETASNERDNFKAELSRAKNNNETSGAEVTQLRTDLASVQADITDRETKLHRQETAIAELEKQLASQVKLEVSKVASPAPSGLDSTTRKEETAHPLPSSSKNSKKNKNKKKKKGPTAEADSKDATTQNHVPSVAESGLESAEKRLPNAKDESAFGSSPQFTELDRLLQQRNTTIESLNEKLRTHEEVLEEVETLREQLMNVGQEHVEAKKKLKSLEVAKSELENSAIDLEKRLQASQNQDVGSGTSAAIEAQKSKLVDQVAALERERDALVVKVHDLERKIADHATARDSRTAADEEAQKGRDEEIEALKARADSLQSELKATDGVAQSRFKELGFLQNAAKKSRTDLESLRAEVATLKTARDEAAGKAIRVRELESRESRLRSELDDLKQRLSEEESAAKRLNERFNAESGRRSNLEEANRKLERDLLRSRKEATDASGARDSLVSRLRDSESEKGSARSKIQELEYQLETLKGDMTGLREDICLKSAQHASAESLMSSLRDQSSEMATQLKEAKDRAESLEDELADAHRLMNERGREGETMRRILSDIESRADARVKEMRERMEVAIQERDRAEDEASTLGRRRARELDDLKNKLRDAERDLRRATDAKSDLERMERDLRQKHADDAERVEQSSQEVTEVRKAMSELRDALDEGERQTREVEAEKASMQRSLEEVQVRLEKVQKSSKTLAEELRTLRANKSRHTDSEAQSSRSSMDSSIPGRVTSPAAVNGRDSPKPKSNGTGTVDYVYLKNVLLQFLEQKDRKYQMQLIPVLGMLLHFDKKDEQRWMSAVTTH